MSELPAYRHNSSSGGLSEFREAAVVFEPTESLTEALSSFLTDTAKERLSNKALQLTLLHSPYQYKESDTKAKAAVRAYRRTIELATPHSLRVAQKWQYWSDKTDEKPPRHLFIAMQVGGTALAGAVAQQPFYRPNIPLQAYVALPKRDLLPGAALEETRQDIAKTLRDQPGRDGIYASPQYQVGYPHISERPVVPLRLVK